MYLGVVLLAFVVLLMDRRKEERSQRSLELAVEYVEVSESQGLSAAIPFSEAGELEFVNHRLLEDNSSLPSRKNRLGAFSVRGGCDICRCG